MAKVELIYDSDCPNVDAARDLLGRALDSVGQPASWCEWDRGDRSSPDYVRAYGSPTILVDGREVTGASPSHGADCCRVYHSEDGGLQGVPPLDALTSALRSGLGPGGAGGGWGTSLAVVPAVGVSMLPGLACPACWPAYAGLLGSFGLGFLTHTSYLLPLTAVFLLLAVGALGYRARNRQGYGPLVIGLIAAVIVLVGKFYFDSDTAMCVGIGLLIGASVLNAWPKPKRSTACAGCAGAGESAGGA